MNFSFSSIVISEFLSKNKAVIDVNISSIVMYFILFKILLFLAQEKYKYYTELLKKVPNNLNFNNLD